MNGMITLVQQCGVKLGTIKKVEDSLQANLLLLGMYITRCFVLVEGAWR